MGLEMGALGVDIGRCEAQGGAPRPLPQPTGPTGPLGPCPAGLAPWMAMQAPKPHPIRPQAGAAAMVSGCRAWPSGGVICHTHAMKVGLGGHNTPWAPLGSCGVLRAALGPL